MAQPFRFLDLPKELRLMIYKFLSINATHQSCFPPDIGRLHFVHHALCGVRILETSRQINEEAKAILGPRLEKIKSQPVQLVANPLDLYTIFPRDVILCLGSTHIYWPEQCQLDIRKVAQQFRYWFLYDTFDITAATDASDQPLGPRRNVEATIAYDDADWSDKTKWGTTHQDYRSSLDGFCDMMQQAMDDISGTLTPLNVKVRVAAPALGSRARNYSLWDNFLRFDVETPTPEGESSIAFADYVHRDEWVIEWAEKERYW